jgi:hypothetical protein
MGENPNYLLLFLGYGGKSKLFSDNTRVWGSAKISSVAAMMCGKTQSSAGEVRAIL